MTADLTTRGAARELHVAPGTVRSLIRDRLLDAYQTRGDSGPYRIKPEALAAYRERMEALRTDPWNRTRPRKAS